jgi:hypothetical protein
MEAHPSEHAEQRLYERFNLILDEDLIQQLAVKLDTGKSALLGYQDNARELHAVEIAGRTVVVVWQPRDRTFITFLHPDEFRGRLMSLGSADMPKLEKSLSAPPTKPQKARKSRLSARARATRKLAVQKAHELRLARYVEWVEQMAVRELRTRRNWLAIGRGIVPNAKPEIHPHPIHPNIVKLYHLSATVLQLGCDHDWLQVDSSYYCLLCQLSPQGR